jgi:hypothetical protein
MSEAEVTEDKVRDEHLKAVNVPAHWIYLVTVLLGGFLLMVLLIALIGGGGG